MPINNVNNLSTVCVVDFIWSIVSYIQWCEQFLDKGQSRGIIRTIKYHVVCFVTHCVQVHRKSFILYFLFFCYKEEKDDSAIK